jgi:hypothetical protein
MTWTVGDRVFHRVKPEWGLGEVDIVGEDGRVEVFFEEAGKKLLQDPQLLRATGEDTSRPLARPAPPKTRRKKSS